MPKQKKGRRLLSGLENGVYHTYSQGPGDVVNGLFDAAQDVIEHARKLVPRQLTNRQRRRFFLLFD